MKTILKYLGTFAVLQCFGATGFSQIGTTIHPGANWNAHPGSTYAVNGHFYNKGNHDHQTASDIMFIGYSLQNYSSNDTVTFHNVLILNSNGIEIDGVLEVSNKMRFIDGQISLNGNSTNNISGSLINTNTKVIFLDGAIVGTGPEAPDDNSFLNLPVQKIGNDAFTFPVGDANLYRPIQMTAPANVNDAFTVQYHRVSPDTVGFNRALKETSIDNVSDLGYYDVDRTVGTSDVVLSLYYDGLEWNSFNHECDLVIGHWNGTQWENLGNGGAVGTSGFLPTGSGLNGTCGSPVAVTSYSPFALASASSGTSLPVELINFTATPVERDVHLSWSTATEINSDLFIIEHSKDGIIWDYLNEAPAQGNSTVVTNYNRIDDRPFIGDNYYRLKQIDFDGTFEYSEVRNVYFHGVSDSDITLYPNPSNRYITIESDADELDVLVITDATGKDITSELSIVERGERHIVLNTQDLQGGFYFVSTPNNKMLRFVKLAK